MCWKQIWRGSNKVLKHLSSETKWSILINKKVERGIYIIRGENVVLIGEINQQQVTNVRGKSGVEMVLVSFDEIMELKRAEDEKEREAEKNKKNALLDRCMLPQCDSILDDYY